MSEMKKIRVGIAGLGHQGLIHLANSLRLKKYCDVVAVADVSEATLFKASHVGVKTYLDYREMIEKEGMDMIVIALPNYLHEDCCLLASESGCDIFLEKPLARNVDEGKRIGSLVERTRVKLMIGMCQRFLKNIQVLKNIVDDGTLGHIEFASALLCASPFWSGSKISDWWFDITKTGGGALLDNGCHLIDLLLWFFGDIKSASGYLEHEFNLDFEDYAEVSLRFKNGTNALVVTSWRTRVPVYQFALVGQWGRKLFVDPTNPFEGNIPKAGLSFMADNIIQKIRGRPFLPLGGDAYFKELKYFMKCLINDEVPKPDVNDGLKVLEVIEEVYSFWSSLRYGGANE